MPDRFLMTGATGFAGGHIAQALRRQWPNAQILDFGTARSSQVPAGVDYKNVDLLDTSGVAECVATFKPGIVIHLAAQASVTHGLADTSETWRINLAGSLNLALAIAGHAPEASVVFASSSEVYGASFLNSPVDELSEPRPLNSYAKSKLAAERMFADILPKSCRLVITRAVNHTGPGQRLDFVLPSFAHQIARIEAGLQEPRLATGNLEVRRDFLDVRDVAQAYVSLCGVLVTLPQHVLVNIASGRPHRLSDLLQLLKGMSRTAFEITLDPARLRPSDLPLAYAQPNFLRALTGWSPSYTIEDTLRALLDDARDTVRAAGKASRMDSA